MKRGTNCTKAREDARAACCAGEVPFFAAADSEHRHEFRAFFQSKRKVTRKTRAHSFDEVTAFLH
jgi:hypothetical protein